ncbi:MAG: choice-of-anchor L domain-containing protein [Flavobacteriales bacterium]|nr:choice-of-anchor L domain-containing protein [Flavobacteriales bacterium]
MKQLLTLALIAAVPVTTKAQLAITPNLSTAEMTELLEGFGMTILNVDIQCAGQAYGQFQGDSELQIYEGVLLTTGDASQVANPASFFATSFTNSGGDPDLAVLAGVPIYDACVLTFDCIPVGDTLLLNFSFGSEEYPEFVCTYFNDVFGLFLSGPGLSGPFTDNAMNIATVPGTSVPIAINTVNGGDPGLGGPNSPCVMADPNFEDNSIYYVDNATGEHTAYDGFTVNLVAFAAVEPGQTYRFKAAVGDAGDGIFDSGVFVEAFSFRSNGLSTSIPTASTPALGLEHHGDAVAILLPADTQGELLLFGDTGQLIRSQRVDSDRVWLDLGGLPTGLYTVRVLDSQGLAPLRFVKG